MSHSIAKCDHDRFLKHNSIHFTVEEFCLIFFCLVRREPQWLILLTQDHNFDTRLNRYKLLNKTRKVLTSDICPCYSAARLAC